MFGFVDAGRLRRLRRMLPVLLLGLALLVPGAPTAAAAVPPVSSRTASVVTADALATAQINGVVWTTAIAGHRLFAGGEFTRARPPGAAPGTREQPRWNLVSVTLDTGALRTWAPRLNGPVRALAVSKDGTVLFVAGGFTKVGSVQRNRFAAFRISDGRLLGMNPSFNGTVNALTVGNYTVFAGGTFTKVNGVTRSRLANVNARSGALTRWAPRSTGTVHALTLTGDLRKVVAGGAFNKVNNVDGRGLVALSSSTGARVPWEINKVVKNYGRNAAILSLAADRDTVYGSGYAYGGGNFEGVFAADDTRGDVRWLQDCHGDTYAVAPVGNVVYSVGHAHFCSNIGGFPEFSPRREYRALAVTRDARGTVAPNSQPGRSYGNFGGRPAPSLFNWFPAVNAGSFTGMSQGAWSVAATSRYLVLGGEFTKVDGRNQQGLVRFTLPSVQRERRGAEDSGASLTPTVTGEAGGKARLAWPTNWDRDEKAITYDVLRNGAVVGRLRRDSTFWNRPTVQYTDQGLAAGQTYRYAIRASHPVDPVTSPEVSFTYAG